MCKNCKSAKLANNAMLNVTNDKITNYEDFLLLGEVLTSVRNKGRKCNLQELNTMKQLYSKITNQGEVDTSRLDNIFKLYNSLSLIYMNNKHNDFSAIVIQEETNEIDNTVVDITVNEPVENTVKEEIDYKSKFGLTNEKLNKINKKFKK